MLKFSNISSNLDNIGLYNSDNFSSRLKPSLSLISSPVDFVNFLVSLVNALKIVDFLHSNKLCCSPF